MENIKKMIEVLHMKEVICEKQFAEEEKKQIAEYDYLIETLQTMEDERNECKETLSKNLQRITTHKHSIYNLCINNSENPMALPISHEYHRQTVTFLSEAINFINGIQNVYRNLDNTTERKINSIDLINDIMSCTKFIGNETCRIKSLITGIETLQNNVNVLHKN
ncbi:uncharacterized protein LOC116431125 [Nomia melanderi]|uniref:uncharacterized protein LOC116431125 n=1 Tax=Nomia melanderi TaxID=2448451 RepID=UPI001304065B|nr:uncharacterized protein LOC116431125 [Nomia melanderi]